jgi:hypothetical protein
MMDLKALAETIANLKVSELQVLKSILYKEFKMDLDIWVRTDKDEPKS